MLTAGSLPDAVRRLLDQDVGMTRALEAHWGGRLTAAVLSSGDDGAILRRCVVLSAPDGRPVEVAGIDVVLAAVPAPLRPALADTATPLGRLFRDHGIGFRAQPLAFFRVAPDAVLAEQAGGTKGVPLYGRIARLVADDGRELARTVEVLARL